MKVLVLIQISLSPLHLVRAERLKITSVLSITALLLFFF